VSGAIEISELKDEREALIHCVRFRTADVGAGVHRGGPTRLIVRDLRTALIPQVLAARRVAGRDASRGLAVAIVTSGWATAGATVISTSAIANTAAATERGLTTGEANSTTPTRRSHSWLPPAVGSAGWLAAADSVELSDPVGRV
jgi:hypothetical protein